jgi:hypothetical protein
MENIVSQKELESHQKLLNSSTSELVAPFGVGELITLLEAARVALADADTFDTIAESLDLSDDELKSLQEKLNSHLNP